jgi:hypothetical protein
MKSQFQINENLLDRIISVAYGDANFLENLKIYFLAAKNDQIKRLLIEYKTSAKAVHSLKQDECPLEILEKVEVSTVKKNRQFSLAVKFLYPLLYKPVFTVSIILLLISGLLFFTLFNKTVNNQYSEAQIKLAEKQVKQSLVLVNKIFYRTAKKVEHDILKEQVAKPVHEGISTINDLFKGG